MMSGKYLLMRSRAIQDPPPPLQQHPCILEGSSRLHYTQAERNKRIRLSQTSVSVKETNLSDFIYIFFFCLVRVFLYKV